MIYNEIDKLIMTSMKEHDEVRTRSLRALKAAVLNWKTAKENVGKTFDDVVEIQLLKKLVKQRQESADMYTQANRLDLATQELAERDIFNEFLPEEVTQNQVSVLFYDLVGQGMEPIKKNMGLFVKAIKERYPTVDGKMAASYVASQLH